MTIRARLLCLGLTAIAPACAGVPELYKPAPGTAGKSVLAPKVEHIVDRITCELAAVSSGRLSGKEYIITVVLTLQVNDEINLTPSLSFIDLLKTPGTSRTFSQNTGLGGARERLFTSTFTYNSKELEANKAASCDGDPQKLYRLDGDLGIADIVRDGMGIGERQTRMAHGSPPGPPSFASQVKFVVTRSVGALGPTWSLVSFKGPGGANGLLNGKSLTTDSVNIAFAVKKDLAPSLATQAQLAELITLVRAANAREQAAAADAQQRRQALQAVIDSEARKNSGPRSQSLLAQQRGRAMIESASAVARAAEMERVQAARESEAAQAALTAARLAATASTQSQSQEEALQAGQNLITTMILQTLTVQPR